MELYYLNLSHNNINEIDVSANTKLTNLIISKNNLSEIDVSTNKLLKDLELSGNSLKEIDLTNNVDLEFLSLDFNNLNSIDVKANTDLTTLGLSKNNLSEIDVSQNTKLERMELSYNNISEIDVSNNPKLFDLSISNNKLNSIVFEKDHKLESLSLSENNLLSLDLTNIKLFENSQFIGFNFKSQTREVYATAKDGNKYEINLKELDKNLDPSKVVFEGQDGVSYDNQTGIITLSKEIDTIKYIYKTGLSIMPESFSEDMDVTLTINYPLKNRTFKIEEGKEFINSTNVKVNITWLDEDVTHYCLTEEDDSNNCSWQDTSGEKSISTNYNFSGEDGVKTLHAYIKNTDSQISKIATATIVLDRSKPTIENFYLGGITNPEYTNNKEVSIYISWQDEDVASYCISKTNSNDGCSWNDTNGKLVNASYTLDDGDENKTVYVFIKDKAGNISEVKEDSIKLDTTKPIIENFYLGGSGNPETVESTTTSIYMNWQDEDVISYCISKTNSSNECNWISTSEKTVNSEYILDSVNGEQTRYAYIKDKAGNISNVKEEKVTLNTEFPLIKDFYVNEDKNEYTTDKNIKIYLNFEEERITHYCINTKNDSSTCEWKEIEEKSIVIDYTLSGEDGIKVLYAYIKDDEERISEVASYSITLDTTKPTIKEFYIGGPSNPEKIDNNKTNVYISVEDEDVISYCISNEKDSSKCKWIDTKEKSIITEYILSEGEGEKELYAYVKDKVGYISEVKSDKVKVEYPKENTTNNNNSNNNNSNNKNEEIKADVDKPAESVKTGSITIGLLIIVGIILYIVYKYKVKKNRIFKI